MVVKWSACFPSTLMIRVQILLKPTVFFCNICVWKERKLGKRGRGLTIKMNSRPKPVTWVLHIGVRQIGHFRKIPTPTIKHFVQFSFQVFQRYLTFCGIGLQNAQLFEVSILEYKKNQVDIPNTICRPKQHELLPVWPDLAKLKKTWAICFQALFSIWLNFQYSLANMFGYLANFHSWKCPKMEK